MNTDLLLLKAIAMSLKNDVRIMQALTLLADQPTRLDDLKTDMRVGFLQTVELLDEIEAVQQGASLTP